MRLAMPAADLGDSMGLRCRPSPGSLQGPAPWAWGRSVVTVLATPGPRAHPKHEGCLPCNPLQVPAPLLYKACPTHAPSASVSPLPPGPTSAGAIFVLLCPLQASARLSSQWPCGQHCCLSVLHASCAQTGGPQWSPNSLPASPTGPSLLLKACCSSTQEAPCLSPSPCGPLRKPCLWDQLTSSMPLGATCG